MVMNKLQVKHSLLIATVLFTSSGLFAIENNFSNVRANNVNDVQVSNPNNID
ncbi:hypothetical protein GKC32_09735, partial [Lactobacillus curvatus]|nr:hypothetical protein [Latilactobacillus curvatus]